MVNGKKWPIDMTIPLRSPGKQSAEQKKRELRFANDLIALAESVDFKLSARGWCYHLEAHGLAKSNFDQAERLINALREEGVLPIDLVATSQQRVVEGLEEVSEHKTAVAFAKHLAREIIPAHIEMWTPRSQWDTQANYVELLVEKIDLIGLFGPVCDEFGVTITNMQGWNDLLRRAEQMLRIVAHRDAGRNPIVLPFTDHDPDGLRIAKLLPEHYKNLANVRWMDGTQIEWSSDSVTVIRIGLDYDLIQSLGLTWIDNLKTSRRNADGTERDLSDPKHKNHRQPYVQEYLKKFGARKVEANALVARIDEARTWLRNLLPQYVDIEALDRYRTEIARQRSRVPGELTRKR